MIILTGMATTITGEKKTIPLDTRAVPSSQNTSVLGLLLADSTKTKMKLPLLAMKHHALLPFYLGQAELTS